MGSAMDDDASIADLPWASVFDPAANVRALSAIQARGFRAATEVVDRFVRITETGFAAPRQPAGESPSTEEGLGSHLDVGRLVSSFQNALAQLTSSAAPAAGPGLDLAHSAASGETYLEAAEPGSAAAVVWLHNRGADDLGKVRLRCSDLLSHDGAVIDTKRIRFEPDVVPMPARSSRGVTVEVDVAQEDAPGRYRGTLLADGYVDVWMPVVLTIKSRIP